MKIAICGSVAFAREMFETKDKLEVLGHEVTIPKNIKKYADGTSGEEDKWEKVEMDVFKVYFEKIKANDSILVLNYDKNDVPNYIGGNSLIEIAFAHILNKKIFLLNPVPSMSYTDEVEAMKPIVLDGSLEKIK